MVHPSLSPTSIHIWCIPPSPLPQYINGTSLSPTSIHIWCIPPSPLPHIPLPYLNTYMVHPSLSPTSHPSPHIWYIPLPYLNTYMVHPSLWFLLHEGCDRTLFSQWVEQLHTCVHTCTHTHTHVHTYTHIHTHTHKYTHSTHKSMNSKANTLTSNFVLPSSTKTVYTPCSGIGCRKRFTTWDLGDLMHTSKRQVQTILMWVVWCWWCGLCDGGGMGCNGVGCGVVWVVWWWWHGL